MCLENKYILFRQEWLYCLTVQLDQSAAFTTGPRLWRTTGDCTVPHNTARSKSKHDATAVKTSFEKHRQMSYKLLCGERQKSGELLTFETSWMPVMQLLYSHLLTREEAAPPVPALQPVPYFWPARICSVHCTISAAQILPIRPGTLFAFCPEKLLDKCSFLDLNCKWDGIGNFCHYSISTDRYFQLSSTLNCFQASFWLSEFSSLFLLHHTIMLNF